MSCGVFRDFFLVFGSTNRNFSKFERCSENAFSNMNSGNVAHRIAPVLCSRICFVLLWFGLCLVLVGTYYFAEKMPLLWIFMLLRCIISFRSCVVTVTFFRRRTKLEFISNFHFHNHTIFENYIAFSVFTVFTTRFSFFFRCCCCCSR